jgi:hypothetical protein
MDTYGSGQWEEAAEQMPGIYDHDAKLWEKSIFAFARKGHLTVTKTTSLPTSQVEGADALWWGVVRKLHHMFQRQTSPSPPSSMK